MARIYVACLAAYNAGRLHGQWINIDSDAAVMRLEVAAMLKASPVPMAEEFAIHDYEGAFPKPFSEYTGLDTIAAWAGVLEQAEEAGIPGDVAAQVASYHGEMFGDFKETLAALESYNGQYETLAAWAQAIEEETGELDKVPEHLQPFIDWHAVARNAEVSGGVSGFRDSEGNLHVFGF